MKCPSCNKNVPDAPFCLFCHQAIRSSVKGTTATDHNRSVQPPTSDYQTGHPKQHKNTTQGNWIVFVVAGLIAWGAAHLFLGNDLPNLTKEPVKSSPVSSQPNVATQQSGSSSKTPPSSGPSVTSQSRSDTNASNYIIDKGRVGKLHIRQGMTMSELRAAFGERNVVTNTRYSDGKAQKVALVYLDGTTSNESLEAYFENNGQTLLNLIIIRDKRFKTPQGIGVGSTTRELRSLHTIDGVGGMPGGDTIAFADQSGMTFFLDVKHTGATSINMVSGDARIRSIMIFGTPAK